MARILTCSADLGAGSVVELGVVGNRTRAACEEACLLSAVEGTAAGLGASRACTALAWNRETGSCHLKHVKDDVRFDQAIPSRAASKAAAAGAGGGGGKRKVVWGIQGEAKQAAWDFCWAAPRDLLPHGYRRSQPQAGLQGAPPSSTCLETER